MCLEGSSVQNEHLMFVSGVEGAMRVGVCRCLSVVWSCVALWGLHVPGVVNRGGCGVEVFCVAGGAWWLYTGC